MNAFPETIAVDEVNCGRARVLPALAAVIGVTALGDFLFWRATPGVSLGIFGLTLGALLLWVCGEVQPRKTVRWLAVLLAASCVQSAIEISFTNVCVTVVLLFAMLGEFTFASLPGGAARLFEAVATVLKSPLRWFGFCAAIFDAPLVRSSSSVVTGSNIAGAFRVLLPGLVLCSIFGVVLISGNVVLGHYFAELAERVREWLLHFDFSPARFALWALFGTLALALYWPGRTRATVREWTQRLPRWHRRAVREAVWQSAFCLLALNALFFAANTVDAIFLWRHAALPRNVNASEYVHAGVWSLTFAVLLSAVVLAGMFQQQEEVSGSRLLKTLAHVWVLQNLALIAGVFLRLKLYVDAYQLTERRVYVGCFLALVMLGFLLLAWAIERSKGLCWLIGANSLATLAMLFALQFPNVAGVVARENVARWRREPGRMLDIEYLVELGPGAWPALATVARSAKHPLLAREARLRLFQLAANERARRAEGDWRSWQARREAGADLVLAFAHGGR